MDDNSLRFYPTAVAFSRQQVQIITGVPNDVLGFWIKQHLLIPRPAEARAHHRFGYEQLHVAAVLNAMRSLGANIGVLRKFAEAIQAGIALCATSGLTYDQLRLGKYLAYTLNRFRRGGLCRVTLEDWWDDPNRLSRSESDRPARDEEEIISDWLKSNRNEGDILPAVGFFRNVTDEQVAQIDMWLDLTMPENLHSPDLNWVWIAWIDEHGHARVHSGEDAAPTIDREMPTAAFYISTSRTIGKLWSDRIEDAQTGYAADLERRRQATIDRLDKSDPEKAAHYRRRWGLRE